MDKEEKEIEELLQQLRYIINNYQKDENDVKLISKIIEKNQKSQNTTSNFPKQISKEKN